MSKLTRPNRPITTVESVHDARASSCCCCSPCRGASHHPVSSPCCCASSPCCCSDFHPSGISGYLGGEGGETSPSLPLVWLPLPGVCRAFRPFVLSTPGVFALISGGYIPVPVRGYPAATAPLKRWQPPATIRRLAARKHRAPPAGASLADTAPPVLCGQRANPARRPGPDVDSPPRPPAGGSHGRTLTAGQGSRANTARRPWLAPLSQPHHQELQGPRANPARRPGPGRFDPPPSPLGGCRWLKRRRPGPAPSAVRHCARPAPQASPAAARAGPLRSLAPSLRQAWGSPSARFAPAVSGVAASPAAPQPLRRPARRSPCWGGEPIALLCP